MDPEAQGTGSGSGSVHPWQQPGSADSTHPLLSGRKDKEGQGGPLWSELTPESDLGRSLSSATTHCMTSSLGSLSFPLLYCKMMTS